VAPQPIENIIKSHPAVAHVMIVGDRRNYICALIVPEEEYLKQLASQLSIDGESIESILQNSNIVKRLDSAILERISHLPRFEQVKKIAYIPDQWSVETGELTPTMKLKRRIIFEKYRDVIDRLYH